MQHATITFHPVITTPLIGGRYRENADLQTILPAPNVGIFCITNQQVNAVLQPFFHIYWLQWSQDYDIVVYGVVWETFTNQEQLSRSTVLQPLHQHNLLNDDQDNLQGDLGNDGGDEPGFDDDDDDDDMSLDESQ